MTTVPVEIASEIPDVCRELMAAEKIVLDYVRSPIALSKVWNSPCCDE